MQLSKEMSSGMRISSYKKYEQCIKRIQVTLDFLVSTEIHLCFLKSIYDTGQSTQF